MNVASSGSVDGTRVVANEDEACAEGDKGEMGWIFGVYIVVVVEDAVSRSLSSSANRTISFAFTIRASRSLRASNISVAVFCAELSAFCIIPSGQ